MRLGDGIQAVPPPYIRHEISDLPKGLSPARRHR
jgi:hypothetical protein